jgi:hypothetical protein
MAWSRVIAAFVARKECGRGMTFDCDEPEYMSHKALFLGLAKLVQ